MWSLTPWTTREFPWEELFGRFALLICEVGDLPAYQMVVLVPVKLTIVSKANQPMPRCFSSMNYGIVACHTGETQSRNTQELDSFRDIFQQFITYNLIHFCEKQSTSKVKCKLTSSILVPLLFLGKSGVRRNQHWEALLEAEGWWKHSHTEPHSLWTAELKARRKLPSKWMNAWRRKRYYFIWPPSIKNSWLFLKKGR